MTQNSINNTSSSLDVSNINITGNTISSTDTNGNVILAPNGTGTVSVTAAPIVPSTDRLDSLGSSANSWNNAFVNGLTFDDGTNILSTFVAKGSFTPEIRFGGNGVGITYTGQIGTFSRIGDVVFYNINIVLSSKGSSTGSTTIIGLPVTATSFSTGATRWSLINFSVGFSQLSAQITNGTTIIALQENGDNVGVGNIQDTQIINTSVINVCGNYFA